MEMKIDILLLASIEIRINTAPRHDRTDDEHTARQRVSWGAIDQSGKCTQFELSPRWLRCCLAACAPCSSLIRAFKSVKCAFGTDKLPYVDAVA
jgi:transposase-like protein